MSERDNDKEGELRFAIEPAEAVKSRRTATVTIRSSRRLLVESLAHHFLSSAPEFAVLDFATAKGNIEKPAVCIVETGERPVDPVQQRHILEDVGSRVPGGSILVLSGCRQDSDAADWLTAGARGYCSTRSSLELLVAAVHVLAAGGIFLPVELAECLLRRAVWPHADV